jgi:hypothetical protein
MTDTQQTVMHADFPRWYREVGLGEDRDRLQRRWNGLSSLIPTLDHPAIENVLRLLFHTAHGPAPEAVAKIRKAFKDADELFDTQGNDREVEILCGALLAVLLEKNEDTAAWTALAISTSALNGNRTSQLPMDLAATAENAVTRIAEVNRVRPKLQDARLEAPKLDFAKAKEKLQAIDQASLNNAFDAAADATNLALSGLVKKFNSAIEQTADFIALQDEELDMLWWVLGERSHGTKKAFASLSKKERPIVFGAELAQVTVYLPGPLSIEGLLIRAGLKGDQNLTIPESVNACDKAWLATLTNGAAFSPLSQPVHFAIQRRLETGDTASWVSGWAAICGVDANVSLPWLTLGNLFYRERLLSIF